jgi:hypothetical protein
VIDLIDSFRGSKRKVGKKVPILEAQKKERKTAIRVSSAEMSPSYISSPCPWVSVFSSWYACNLPWLTSPRALPLSTRRSYYHIPDATAPVLSLSCPIAPPPLSHLQ